MVSELSIMLKFSGSEVPSRSDPGRMLPSIPGVRSPPSPPNRSEAPSAARREVVVERARRRRRRRPPVHRHLHRPTAAPPELVLASPVAADDDLPLRLEVVTRFMKPSPWREEVALVAKPNAPPLASLCERLPRRISSKKTG